MIINLNDFMDNSYLEGEPRIERPIQKLELVFHHSGHPSESFSIRVDGREDYGIFTGSGRFIEAVTIEKLYELFPYAFRMQQEEEPGKQKLICDKKGLLRIIEDEAGIRRLSETLGISIEVVKEQPDFNRGRRNRTDTVERKIIGHQVGPQM